MCMATAMSQVEAVPALLSAALARSIGAGMPVNRACTETRVVVILQLDIIRKQIGIKGTCSRLQAIPKRSPDKSVRETMCLQWQTPGSSAQLCIRKATCLWPCLMPWRTQQSCS